MAKRNKHSKLFSDSEWKKYYNDVFKVFPPPDDLEQIIVLNTPQGKQTFKKTSEFLSYMCLQEKEPSNDDFTYTIKNDELKKEIELKIQEMLWFNEQRG